MLHFSLNLEYALLVHLKMTGRFYCPSNRNDLDSHTRIIFKMKKKGLLAFADIRKFGVIYLIKKDKVKEFPYIQRLGIDPLSKQYSLKVFKEALKKYQQKTLKALLLEQSFVAGIGNIYAAEILFKSRLSPLRKVNSLKVKEVALLFRNIKGILLTAIKYRGTTSSDFRDVDGKSGGFQNILKVYGREDEKCLLCKSKIERIVQNGRSTFYCRKCQK
jgi:formamidopyrimidine-DNA glycosylase